jgi:hypothetical protein
MTEFEQLASDALVTPERVLPGQPQHQLPPLSAGSFGRPGPRQQPNAARR